MQIAGYDVWSSAMWNVYRFVAVFTLSVLFAPRPSRAEGPARWPQEPNEFAVTLSVGQAIEEGPVVCTVTLKNVSKATLKYATWRSEMCAYCRVDTGWKARKEPAIRQYANNGMVGPFEHRLPAGGTASERFYLHKSYLSTPPGKATFRFGWHVYRVVENPPDKGRWEARSLDLLFELKGTQTVEVLSATEKHLAPVLRSLQAEFAELVKRTGQEPDYICRSYDAWSEWVRRIDGCRHKEFVPLLLQAIDRLPGEQFRRQLIGTVYESFATPEEGFAALAAYLASRRPASAVDILDYWAEQQRAHEWSRRRQQELEKPLHEEPDPVKARRQKLLRALRLAEVEAWKGSRRHFDTRLTKEQFGRLRSMKDVWVRVLFYAYYPEQCPADWLDTLVKDLRDVVRAPKRLGDLIAKLDDDSFRVRQEATAELIKSGPEFAWHLWAVSEDKLSLEAAHRLRRVRASLQKPDLPRLCQRTILRLARDPNPHCEKMINILRANAQPNLISQAAEQAYEQYHKGKQADVVAPNSGVEKQGEKR